MSPYGGTCDPLSALYHRPWRLWIALALCCVLGSACGDAASSATTGTDDTAGSTTDTNLPTEDATQTNTSPDGEGSDGTSGSTSGDTAADAADLSDVTKPSGPLTALLPCEDAVADVYGVPLVGLGAPDPTKRGEILGCATGRTMTALEAQTRLNTSAVLGVIAAAGDIQTLRITYQTERANGDAGLSSALVYLPQNPPEGRKPIIVIAHGTVGIADVCAPSTELLEGLLDYLALPWAAAGYPVIATDYAGLGTEGVQGYGDNTDTGLSTLDAARALRAMLPPERLTDQVFLVGHSQGGGAVLSAQALNKDYGCGGELAGVIAYAPGWAVSVNTLPWQFPFASTALGGGGPAALTALFLYAYHANALGEDRAGEGFPALTSANLVAAVESQCITQLAVSVPTLTVTFYGLVEEVFRQTFVDCADGGACEPPGDAFAQFMADNILHADPDGAPILIAQGLTDVVATAAETACIIKHLETDNAPLQVCVDASPHTNVAQNNVAFALQWVQALTEGQDAPTCSGVGLPECL